MECTEQATASDAAAGATVLIVDDEDALRSSLSLGLSERGYRVLQAENVGSAQRLLREHGQIDIVIAYVRLPGGPDGTELAIWLYRFVPDTILILTSGYFEHAEAEAGPLVYGYRLPKPFRPSQAANLIERCLAKRAAERVRVKEFQPSAWN